MHTPGRLLALSLSLAVGSALASPPQPLHPGAPDVRPSARSHILQIHGLPGGSLQAVSAADVGDADSFGRNVVYAGIIGSDDVYLQQDCAGFPGGNPSNQCLVLNPQPAVTNFDLTDIGHITLPANSTHSILCFHTITFQGWDFANETGAAGESEIRFEESLTVESDLLNDPSLIDPTTGLPFNGELTAYVGTNIGDGGTLQPGEDRHHEAFATRTCQGGAISTSALKELYGLPDQVANKFFKEPITIRLNVNGTASLVHDAFLSMGVRFYGD